MPSGRPGLTRTAWNSSHSETKPLSGGRAEIAAAPTRKQALVTGSRWISPPNRSMSRSCVACSTAPAPMNSRLLNSVWFKACRRAADSAIAAAAGSPLAVKASANPRAM